MRLVRLVACGCAVLGFIWSLAVAADSPKPTDDAAIQRALLELDHSEWTTRERATEALLRFGAPAVRALAQRAATGTPEAAVRATEILAAFYADESFPAVDELETELEQLIVTKGSVGEMARRAWEDHRLDREQRALEHFQELGGTIQYPLPGRAILDEQEPNASVIDSVVITRRWKGGDEGLKYVRRLTRFQLERRIYRVNGAPVSDAAIEQLEQAGFRVEPRGALLGITNGGGPIGVDIEGCEVDSIKPDSPAEKAGLQENDVITKFNEHAVPDFKDLIELLKAAEPGQKATLTVQRAGTMLQIPVELGDW